MINLTKQNQSCTNLNLTDEGEADSEMMEDDSSSFTQDDFDNSFQVRRVDSWEKGR